MENKEKVYDFRIILNEQTPSISTPREGYNPDNHELYEKFLKYAMSHDRAIGLAANQCSLNGERMQNDFFALKTQKHGWQIAISPKILEFKGMVVDRLEGCLTWTSKNVLARRHVEVVVSYTTIMKDDSGKIIPVIVDEETLIGIESQLFQHEMNHLNGVEEILVPKNSRLHIKDFPRNEPCGCGSGLKFKKCCKDKM